MKQIDPGNKTNPQSRNLLWLKVMVLSVVLVMTAFHLRLAAKGANDFRDQHLGTALEYAKGKIDLLRPVIVGFTAGGTPVALEIPFWQATVAVFFKCFGPWFGWANLVSCLFMVAGLWPLFQLAKPIVGERGAWWTLVFFTTQPLIFWLGGHGGTDESCLTFTLWFLFFAVKLVETAQFKWFFPAVFFAALSATTKAPFFFCAGLASFFLLFLQFRKSLRRWILLGLVGFLATLVFMCWNHHTNNLITHSEFPFVDLRVSFSGDKGENSAFWWYFGDLHYRLNPAIWAKAAWRFLNVQFGSFVLLGMSIAGFFLLRKSVFRYLLLGFAITTLVFSHVILHHDNYFLMVSPVVAISGAAVLCQLEAGIDKNYPKLTRWLPLGVTVLLLLATIQGLIGMRFVLDTDPYPRQMAKVIQEYTTPADKLLIQGGNWGGMELFLANRTGLSIFNTEIIETPKNLNRLRELGYTKLVMISSSPLVNAVQRSNPGGANIQRRSYREGLTPTAEHWPTLFENEDILIKAIPPQ